MWPDKAQYRPGDQVTLHVPGASQVLLFEMGRLVEALPVRDGLARWTAPDVGPNAPRGFRADAVDGDGNTFAATAFDVARHWSVAPRYGFLSEFTPADTAGAVEGLNRLHINVVQFYDWMYTHYQFFASEEEFIDPLGRSTSHRVVRERVEACHRFGMAALAYGALYGGEKAIAEQHPEWLLYDGSGRPYSLGDFFFIQNVERGCGWRELILGEFEAAVERLGFDGIHIDQYGFPKRGIYRPAPGEERLVDMTMTMADFVSEAGRRIKALRPDGGNIFNCVNNWPVEEVAPLTEDAATYIEVWAPNETYRDLHELVRHARAAGPHKQVILAAYLQAFHREHARPEGAMNTLQLAMAAIHASGGFHLLLGEGDGVLAEGYYPRFGRLSAEELALVQRYSDFVVAYGELLHDLSLRDVSYTWNGGINDETKYHGPAVFSPMAEPGTVWTLQHEKPGRRVLHLLNLTGLQHTRWNTEQGVPLPVEGIEIELQAVSQIRAVWCASPDTEGGAIRLDAEPILDGRPYLRVKLPKLLYWTMLWTEE